MFRPRHIYEDFGRRREPTGWNGADVLRADGLFQHGTVVEALDEGLGIDFDDDPHSIMLMEYGTAFHCSHTFATFHAGENVLALLRDGPQQPWIWRPAKLLMDCTAEREEPWREWVAIVEVLLHGVKSEIIVGISQLRSLAAPPAPLIVKGTFVTRECPMPALDVQPPAWNLVLEKLSRHDNVLPLDVSSDEMVYLQRSRGKLPLDCDRLERWITEAQETMEDLLKREFTYVDKGWRCPVPRIILPVENAEPDDLQMLDMPADLFVEVFAYLDSLDRSRSRRVCRLFGIVLTAAIFPDVVITIRSCPSREVSGEACANCTVYPFDYLIVASLLHCFTIHTTHVVVINGSEEIIMQLSHHLHSAVEQRWQKGHGPLKIVASQAEIGACSYHSYESSLEDLCSTSHPVLLTRSTFSLLDTRPALPFSGRLDLAVGVSVRIGKAWQLLDNSVPPVDATATAEWVRQAVQLQSENRADIVQVLEEYCTTDPRASNLYANHAWTEDNLAHLDVTKLSAVCLFALNSHIPE